MAQLNLYSLEPFCFNDEKGKERKYLFIFSQLVSLLVNCTYFIIKVERRVSLVLIFEKKKENDDAAVMAFLREIVAHLRNKNIFSTLASSDGMNVNQPREVSDDGTEDGTEEATDGTEGTEEDDSENEMEEEKSEVDLDENEVYEISAEKKQMNTLNDADQTIGETETITHNKDERIQEKISETGDLENIIPTNEAQSIEEDARDVREDKKHEMSNADV